MKVTDVPAWALASIFLLLGVFIGAWGEAKIYPTIHTVEKTVPVVTEKVITQTDTQIAYVPKETIKYIDSKTGKEITAKEATDVQADVSQPAVNVKVNGQDYKFSLLQGESQKFQEGKVVLTQTSQIGMDIKVPTIDKTKRNGAFLEVTNKDISIDLDRDNYGLAIGKVWKDGSLRVGGRVGIKF